MTEWHPREEAWQRARSFARRFGEPHVRLAMHAAVPIGLTPELLHLIRVNFVPGIPWVAEADLLLSPICRDVGGGFFEIDEELRRLLIEELQRDPEFGPDRLSLVADFLGAWAERVRSAEPSRDPEWSDFVEGQWLTALSFQSPEKAAHALATSLSSSARGERTGARVIKLTQGLSAALMSQVEIVTYAVALDKLNEGDVEGAMEHFNVLGPIDQPVKIGNVTLPAPAELGIEERREEAHAKTARPRRIFLAYRMNVEPDQALVRRIQIYLEAAGHRVFNASRDIPLGSEWASTIENALRDTDVMIAVLSAQSLSSEWIRYEIELAKRHNMHLAWVRIGEVSDRFTIGPPNVLWRSGKDTDGVLKNILRVIETFDSVKPQPETRPRGFISYDRVDQELAETIYQHLRTQGNPVFSDIQDIPPGGKFSDTIERYVREADFVVVLVSPEALSSPYVVSEVNTALKAGKLILPFLIRNTRPMPGLSNIHHAMWNSEADTQALLQQIDHAISNLARDPKPPEPPQLRPVRPEGLRFNPKLDDTLQLFGEEYQFQELPSTTGFGIVYAVEGARSVVYKLSGKRGQFALKVLRRKFRSDRVVQSAENLRRLARHPGMTAAERRVITSDERAARQFRDLEFAILMPWVQGRTWFDFLTLAQRGDALYSPAAARSVATQFVQVMAGLESQEIAHANISSDNVLIEMSINNIQLVDLEHLYMPGARQPEDLPIGVPGYQHPAHEITWRPSGDRYAATILTAELLLLADERLARSAEPEGFFAGNRSDPRAQQRFEMAQEYLHKMFPHVSKLLYVAWNSSSLEACSRIAELLEAVKHGGPQFGA